MKQIKVFTNGCFDIVHQGHIELLLYCKSIGDILIIGINSDLSVKLNKGTHRPFLDEKIRKGFLQSLQIADEVLLFNEQTPYHLIQTLQPDIIVKGGDYNKNDVVGFDLVKDIRIFPLKDGFSSTKIANQIIQKNYQENHITKDIDSLIAAIKESRQSILNYTNTISQKIRLAMSNNSRIITFGNNTSRDFYQQLNSLTSFRHKTNNILNIKTFIEDSNDLHDIENLTGPNDVIIAISYQEDDIKIKNTLDHLKSNLCIDNVFQFAGKSKLTLNQTNIFNVVSNNNFVIDTVHRILINEICKSLDK
ncbi:MULTISPECIES: adenylyltransferase/cytidyltransferase family protein [unclassified Prochlorococcus]|uniref:adenylyltransferase/cytidyltransferase family protein n=1 Tax=unclassified Prochlorococcus TaxID=2627481 RepID=UPI000533B289|nr:MULTISPECIES: adenylyltransferase/cytidyltransferase family protein [unclassified Prochlorococcus]KGG16327.1 ADP-heptose synthase [Prochlorococcus sp. MIT 0603]KGG17939.1 ADP-heptose synthase [Prochlorococcus sp. MIT 0602]